MATPEGEITHTVTVGEADAGARLDRMLALAVAELSRTRIKALIEEDVLEGEVAEELRVATCLMQDLGVNPAGVDVILHMRRRLLVLQSRMSETLRRLLDERESRRG